MKRWTVKYKSKRGNSTAQIKAPSKKDAKAKFKHFDEVNVVEYVKSEKVK